MEEEKFGLSFEDEIKQVVLRFERMRNNNENYFFDVIEFESLIDYYIESNNSTRALEAALIASKQHPNSVSIQLKKAKVLLDKGRAVETLKIIRKLENIEPGNHEIYIVKGTAMGILGDISGAKKMFDQALKQDSDDIENILFSVVTVLQNLNYYEHLIPYLQRLIELEPDFTAHIYDLAFAYEKTGDFSKSIQHYLKYLEDEPFSDSAWYNLGIIYNKTNETEKALEAYDYALAINDQNSFAVFNKANILYNTDRFEEAIPVYLEYLDYESDSIEALTFLAECYEKTDEITLARKYYHEALELDSDFADPWFGLGVIELNNGNIDDSLIYFRKAVKLDDENPEFWYLLGKAHLAKAEKKAALRCFREALKLDPYYGEVWADLGYTIWKENLAERAVNYLEFAYKITGDVPGLNYLLAAFYLRTQKHQKALIHLNLAIDQDMELYKEFTGLFTPDILTKDIIKLLERNNLF